MRGISVFGRLLAGAASLLAVGAASAADFDSPYFGGPYAPAPSYAYGGDEQSYGEGVDIGGIGIGAGMGVGVVGYDQGYYYGGYQHPAGGYGGGDYRRAAYSAADAYVSGGYYAPVPARPYAVARPIHGPYAPGYYAPRASYYRTAGYQPYRHGPRRRCHCETLY